MGACICAVTRELCRPSHPYDFAITTTRDGAAATVEIGVTDITQRRDAEDTDLVACRTKDDAPTQAEEEEHTLHPPSRYKLPDTAPRRATDLTGSAVIILYFYSTDDEVVKNVQSLVPDQTGPIGDIIGTERILTWLQCYEPFCAEPLLTEMRHCEEAAVATRTFAGNDADLPALRRSTYNCMRFAMQYNPVHAPLLKGDILARFSFNLGHDSTSGLLHVLFVPRAGRVFYAGCADCAQTLAVQL